MSTLGYYATQSQKRHGLVEALREQIASSREDTPQVQEGLMPACRACRSRPVIRPSVRKGGFMAFCKCYVPHPSHGATATGAAERWKADHGVDAVKTGVTEHFKPPASAPGFIS